MKKLKLVSSIMALIVAIGVLYSCDDQSVVDPVSDDADLIDQIASAANRQNVSITALPSGALAVLQADFTESFIGSAALAPELGYEVTMRVSSGADIGESSSAFFNLEGRELDAEASFFERRNGRRGRIGRRARGLRDCFDFVFPVSLTVPDGSTITLESKDDWSLVKDWYEANPDAEGRPEFVYPLEVEFGDSTLVINNAEELEAAKGACEIDRQCGRCFELVLPVTYTMPDGSEITIATQDDWALIDAWYEDNPDVSERPELVFPVDIQYANDSIVTVNSAEELRGARAQCEVRRGRERCFQIEFPQSFTMPDGSAITLESKDDWELIKEWYDANPDEEDRPELVFPITITYQDGSQATISSEEELEAAKDSCG